MKTLGEIMKSPVLDIDHTAVVSQCVSKIYNNHIGCLLVKENGKYVGVVTKTDLMHKVLLNDLNPESLKVSEIMTKTVYSMDQDVTVKDANVFMNQKKIRHLPVTQNGEIFGIISISDLFSMSADAFK